MVKRTLTAALAATGLLAGGMTMAAPAAQAQACVAITVANMGSYPVVLEYMTLDSDIGGITNYDYDDGECTGTAPTRVQQTIDSRTAWTSSYGLTNPWNNFEQSTKLVFSLTTVEGCRLGDWNNPPYATLYDGTLSTTAQGFNGAEAETVDAVAGFANRIHVTLTGNWIDNEWQKCNPGVASLEEVNDSAVGAAADVSTEVVPGDDNPIVNENDIENPLDAPAPADDDKSGTDDAGTDDAGDDGAVEQGTSLDTRSKTLTAGGHQVVAKHHTRVEKMAAKVHNKGGVLTIHAYGPDEDLALARARAVRAHLEAQLAKRGHTESSPIWVTYAGDPAHKKNTHVTVHWHPDTALPGALPGAK